MIFAGPGIEESRVDDRVTGLLDLSATILDLAGVPALPGQVGRSLASKDPWTHRVTSSYYGGLMNIKTKALRHRMLRQNSLKLCVYDGHAPQLFDLEADPDELCDIAPSRPKDVKRLSDDLTAGWDVETLTRTQKRNAARAELLRGWVKAVHPPERLRWCDPNPERNRYR
jgi:choline-sulfatase